MKQKILTLLILLALQTEFLTADKTNITSRASQSPKATNTCQQILI